MKTPVNTDITVREKSAWIRWLPNALPAVGYIGLKNSSDERLDITRITSPDYRSITICRTVTGVEASKTVRHDGVTLSAKGGFAFTPGSYHLVLEKPTRLITPGDNARIVFFLGDGKVFKVRVPVRTSPEPH
ncbi:copper chaperone PCu(A)C [Kitasatospora sp. NPDC101235]|uniref:copper chaperone PCu(A)C n=1 Tax=Kitasatospora sp. NPDC101235 TaxID=3364101 RepID=UPI0038127343